MRDQEFAIAAVSPIRLEWTGDRALADWLSCFQSTHFHFGSEFCEHLLPTDRTLRIALQRAAQVNFQLVLLTPVAFPDVLRRLEALLPLLPENAEVVVNDWGVGRLIAERLPACRITAGRILCRMVKDPRLAGPEWAAQCDHGLDSASMITVLHRIRVERLEIDMPLFGGLDALRRIPPPASVHFPYFYVA